MNVPFPPRPPALPPAAAEFASHAFDAALRLGRPLRGLLRRLPTQPPSWLAAAALDRLLLPRLDDDTREACRDRVVELELSDLGVRLRLRFDGTRFSAASGEPELRVRAATRALLRLVRGEDDADRLFFDRELVMEGDTEFGLLLKNQLDAIGPLWV
jgi:predicted lipid carrier protein YhbT